MVKTDDYNRLREIWRSMKKRCYNPKCKDYPNYGGRQITVYEPWLKDFQNFYTWAMSHGYKSELTIDRVCNNRGYNPGNCKWISRKAQSYNRSTNTRIAIDGRNRTIAQWSAISGISEDIIIHRMEAGWSEKDAVFKPRRVYNKKKV